MIPFTENVEELIFEICMFTIKQMNVGNNHGELF